jgi:hypothetical protein
VWEAGCRGSGEKVEGEGPMQREKGSETSRGGGNDTEWGWATSGVDKNLIGIFLISFSRVIC